MPKRKDGSKLFVDEKLLHQILDVLPIGVWIADSEGTLIANNPAGRAIWAGERWIGTESYGEYIGWWSATGKRVGAEEWGMARAVMSGETSSNEMVDIQCFDGSRKTILNSAIPLRNATGKTVVAVATNQDITELKNTQDALLLSRRQLEALSNAALDMQEQERKRLSMELHDEIGQTLSALKIMIETARRRSQDDTLDDILQQAAGATDTLVSDIREIARRLRPPPLDDLGLAAALRWHLDTLARATSLSIELSAELEDERFDPALELGCFRIVQEAVSNVLRHAGASNVYIFLSRTEHHLRLTIRDNGCGFLVDKVYSALSHHPLGLLGMRERAAALGGEMRIHSAPGQGTEIELTFPLQSSA